MRLINLFGEFPRKSWRNDLLLSLLTGAADQHAYPIFQKLLNEIIIAQNVFPKNYNGCLPKTKMVLPPLLINVGLHFMQTHHPILGRLHNTEIYRIDFN